VEFVKQKTAETEDEDEREAYTGILQQLLDFVTVKSTQERGTSYENEQFLNEILRRPGQYRRQYVEENSDKVTDAFVAYVMDQSKVYDDMNSKVVVASILRILGEVKGADFFTEQSNMRELSVVDLDKDDEAKPVLLEKRQDPDEVLLAEFVFSTDDVLDLILKNMHRIDDKFIKFLENRAEKSMLADERIALNSLRETIERALERIRELEQEQDLISAQPLSASVIKSRMKSIQAGLSTEKPEDPLREEIRIEGEATATFEKLLGKLLNRPGNFTLEDAVNAYYENCDYAFMKRLASKMEV
jgi:hypothetical protein